MFCLFSPPDQLHSDQGKQFKSAVVQEICKILGMQKSRSSPYYQKFDGVAESFNRNLSNMLATTSHNHPFDWEDQLPKVCISYNTSVQTITGYIHSSWFSANRLECQLT